MYVVWIGTYHLPSLFVFLGRSRFNVSQHNTFHASILKVLFLLLRYNHVFLSTLKTVFFSFPGPKTSNPLITIFGGVRTTKFQLQSSQMHTQANKPVQANLYFKLFVNPFRLVQKSFKYTWWLQSSWLCMGVCEPLLPSMK